MVQPVSSAATRALLKASTDTGLAAGVAALRSQNQAAQALVDQLQQGLDQQKASNRITLAQAAPAAGTPPPPRGSLVDVLA